MKRLAAILLGLLALAVPLACDDKEDGESTDSETASDTTETGATETSSDATETGEPGVCPDEFPIFDDSCSVNSDCALVLHTISCCGTNVAWGIAAGEVAAFDEVEAVCDSEYPECDCAPLPTVAEDGNSTEDQSALAVSCEMGACTSYVLP
jgi:hypothetical protein